MVSVGFAGKGVFRKDLKNSKD